MIGRGHGSSFIRQLRRRLVERAEPARRDRSRPRQSAGGRAYIKAGFQSERLVDTPDGQVLLMARNA